MLWNVQYVRNLHVLRWPVKAPPNHNHGQYRLLCTYVEPDVLLEENLAQRSCHARRTLSEESILPKSLVHGPWISESLKIV